MNFNRPMIKKQSNRFLHIASHGYDLIKPVKNIFGHHFPLGHGSLFPQHFINIYVCIWTILK